MSTLSIASEKGTTLSDQNGDSFLDFNPSFNIFEISSILFSFIEYLFHYFLSNYSIISFLIKGFF